MDHARGATTRAEIHIASLCGLAIGLSDMPDVFAPATLSPAPSKQALTPRGSAVARYGLSLTLVALATLAAFLVREVAGAPNVTLVFVLAVVIAATCFGFGPAMIASLASVLVFDFFFTQPYHSLRIDSPSDIAAAGLLLGHRRHRKHGGGRGAPQGPRGPPRRRARQRIARRGSPSRAGRSPGRGRGRSGGGA